MICLVRKGAPKGAPVTPKGTKQAEEEWQDLFLKKYWGDSIKPYFPDVPLSVTIRAYMKNPMKRRINFRVDELAKLVLDALQGLAYADDKQVVQIQAQKMKGTSRTEVAIQDMAL